MVVLVWRDSRFKSCCTMSSTELWASPQRCCLSSTNSVALLYHFYMVVVLLLVWVPDIVLIESVLLALGVTGV